MDGIADVHRAYLGNTITLTKLGPRLHSLRLLADTMQVCWVCHPTWPPRWPNQLRPPSVGNSTHELIDNAAMPQ